MDIKISIRAPAKGATRYFDKLKREYKISIRAPAKGATFQLRNKQDANGFQSALPRRERRPLPV